MEFTNIFTFILLSLWNFITIANVNAENHIYFIFFNIAITIFLIIDEIYNVK